MDNEKVVEFKKRIIMPEDSKDWDSEELLKYALENKSILKSQKLILIAYDSEEDRLQYLQSGCSRYEFLGLLTDMINVP